MTGADRDNMSLSHYNGVTSPAARNEEKITANNCPVRQVVGTDRTQTRGIIFYSRFGRLIIFYLFKIGDQKFL